MKLALDNASFVIDEGEVVGLLGLNGAGKSTTMNILTGCVSATGGTVSIGGYDIAQNPRQAKRIIGYLPEQPAFYPEMNVWEHLSFLCGLKGVDSDRETHIAGICDLAGLEGMRRRMVRNLSKGYRQRLGFASALIGNPKAIVLDEPTVGLDPSQVIEMRRMIRSASRHGAVIVSSHILSEIQAMCDRVIVLSEGHIIADCTLDEITKSLTTGSSVFVRILGDAEEILSVLRRVPGVKSAKRLAQNEPGTWDFRLEGIGGSDIRPPLFHILAEASLPLLVSYDDNSGASLEEAFLRLAIGRADASEKEDAQ
ncbi:MAG: ABC transporter ATP-binding protein [Clostridia bacterium]|nr:ABC transporter ATP-binding protein [Clostridia bacterium]